MIYRDPRYVEVAFVCRRLRPKSAAEAFLFLPHDDPEELALAFYSAPLRWAAYHGQEPAVIFGAFPMHPGVWALFGFGTEDYATVLGDVTRAFRREVFEAVSATGAHRAQALSPASHTDTHKWLVMLGGREEATLRGYAKSGEDVKVFAWTKEDADVWR